jgi:LDH2 family malate/lactate/ureidoglycolate dehydrogenase
MSSWLASSDTSPGVYRARIPGEHGAKAPAECERHGVPLDGEKWRDLLGLAGQTDLKPLATL